MYNKIFSIGFKVPIYNWASHLEDSALEQAINLAKHSRIVKPVVLCPDAHSGYGMPIGGVIAIRDAVIPNAVGVDIGCSMTASKISLKNAEVSRDDLRKVIDIIKSKVPVGKNHHKEPQADDLFDDKERWDSTNVCSNEYESAKHQLGTMGGGNHFIEIQVDEEGYLWYMVHSGSRNLGYKVGNYYNKVAENLCLRWGYESEVKNMLAFLPKGDPAYADYMKEMGICLEFAYANHKHMQHVIEGAFETIFGDVSFSSPIYTRHNYASAEDGLMVHRKGAIRADEGLHIIPGSQGTASYIVEGLGNPVSLCSASHGSGRVMSRTAARKSLSLDEEQSKMSGIIHGMTSVDKLDEAPSAYKDIDEVIRLEEDLVKPVHKLKPVAVIKE